MAIDSTMLRFSPFCFYRQSFLICILATRELLRRYLASAISLSHRTIQSFALASVFHRRGEKFNYLLREIDFYDVLKALRETLYDLRREEGGNWASLSRYN